MSCARWLAGRVLGCSLLALGARLQAPAAAQCQLEHEVKLVPNPLAASESGRALAVEGDVLVVGVPMEDALGANSGAAYVYRRTGGQWTFEARLEALDAGAGDRFGSAVDVEGDRIVVGAEHQSEVGLTAAGAVYVFERQSSAWVETARLVATVRAEIDLLGCALAVDGDTIVAGAYGHGTISQPEQGIVYVFQQDGMAWSERAQLTASVPVAQGRFGWSVDAAAGRILVGSYNSTLHLPELFRWNGSSWASEATFSRSNGVRSGQLGYSVALADTRLVLGAPAGSGGVVTGNDGEAYVVDFDGASWVPTQRLVLDAAGLTGDRIGHALAFHGDRVVLGATQTDQVNDLEGYACVFRLYGGLWRPEITLLRPSDAAAADTFGHAVAFDGTTLAVGSPLHDEAGQADAGAVYVYRFEGAGGSPDCNANGIEDPCDITDGATLDCNGNGAPDSCEGLPDCDVDGLPDACEADCNGNGQPDECEGLEDCDLDGVPDECEPDCDFDGLPDDCDAQTLASFQGAPSVPAPTPREAAQFAFDVARAGNVLVVGAPMDGAYGPVVGAAYVYRLSGSTYVFEQALRPDEASQVGEFGISVDAQGERILVGARRERVGSFSNAGAAYVYRRQGGQWLQEARLVPSDPEEQGFFGKSVALDGDTIVVGAFGQGGAAPADYLGAAYVFRWNGSTWDEVAQLTAETRVLGGKFAEAVALSGEWIAAGHAEPEAGAKVELFRRVGNDWMHFQVLGGSTANSRFGTALALRGTRLVVGAPTGAGSSVAGNDGEAFVLDYDPLADAWVETQKLTTQAAEVAGDRFGQAVALWGSRVVVGAPQESNGGSAVGVGYVVPFRLGQTGWMEEPRLRPSGLATGNALGLGIALQGTHLLVGAPRQDDGSLQGAGRLHAYALVGCDDSADCNRNGVEDELDIALGTSLDCDGNGVPDECQDDEDGDGTIDACDECPLDPAKVDPGACGCGLPDDDTDADGIPDCFDNCPSIANAGQEDCDLDGLGDACELTAGAADCDGNGVPDECQLASEDGDGDGAIDPCDGCPADSTKVDPGVCGCGLPDVDSDGDGWLDCLDNCPALPNPAQGDCDDDGLGDVCELAAGSSDCDGNGVPDECQGDEDMDGVFDPCDGCPLDGAKVDPGTCGCGVPDVDTDGDGWLDCLDNCPSVHNSDQADADADGLGDACERWYVDLDALGTRDGRSWTNAFVDLQDALAVAQSGDEIWVAEGTYRPTSGSSRTLSFQLRSGVAVYGGFAGFETLREQRDPLLHATILSGDLAGDDTPGFGGRADNSYQVVTATNVNLTTRLDGFVVRGGNGETRNGGGLSLTGASLVIANCTVTDNRARSGGGLYLASGAPLLLDCVFADNASTNSGGGLCSTGAPTLLRCTIERNTTPGNGGGLLSTRGLQLDRCTLADNFASNGAGLYAASSQPISIRESSLLRNQATVYGGGAYVSASGAAEIRGSTFEANRAASAGGLNASGVFVGTSDFLDNVATSVAGGARIEHSTQVERCRFVRNFALRGGGLSQERSSTRAVESCIFLENQASREGGGAYVHSHAATPALVNCSFSGNVALLRGGALYELHNASYDTELVNCVLWGNTAPSNPQVYGLVRRYCTIQGGSAGPGNSASDPLFVAPASGDLRLLAGSPCIDSGDNAALAAAASLDLGGLGRFHDDPLTTDLGLGTAPIVDRGAHEFDSVPGCEADCDADGVCDADEILNGSADLDANGVPDECQGAVEQSGWDAGETAVLLVGASSDPLLDPVVIATNVDGPDDGAISAVSGSDIVPGAGGYSVLGRVVTIETDVPDGSFFLQLSVPFTQADLGGASWDQVDLTYYDPGSGDWRLAVEGNLQASPGHPGPAGDRTALMGSMVPSLSAELGDYGVFWNPSLNRGFVWANVDHTTPFAPGLAFGTLVDCDGSGQSDAEDILLGLVADCDGDGVPDSCQTALDPVQDCDSDGRPDRCQIEADPTLDTWPEEGDGVLDSCQDVHPVRTLRAPRLR